MGSGRWGAVGPSVGIVGGGVAGLALAALLAQRGHAVTVYEAAAPGGKLRRLEGFDTGPSLFTFPGVWSRLRARLGETGPDPLWLRPLPGGLGPHHTPHGVVPLPVPPGHPLHADWARYAAKVAPAAAALEVLLTTPPDLRSPAFLRASARLAPLLGGHLTAAGWLSAQSLPPALHHALSVHALNAGLSPQAAPALYALLPGLIAGDVWVPEEGLGALVDELLRLGAARGVRLRRARVEAAREQTLRLEGGETVHHALIVSALDPARRRALLGQRVPDGPRTVSGVALYAASPAGLPLPPTSVVTPDDYRVFRGAMTARALPPNTLALVHNRRGQLAALLTAPPDGREYRPDHPWVQAQLARVGRALGVPQLPELMAGALTLDPHHFALGGAPGGAIYGRALAPWRGGPLHPEAYRLRAGLWQVGAGVHPGGGLPAVLGGALIVDELMARGRWRGL